MERSWYFPQSLAHGLLLIVLCAAMTAQSQPPPPKADGGGAGGDGACSESSQTVGDGTLLSIVGLSGNPTDSVINGMTRINVADAPTVNMGSINFQPSGMPHSRYAGGTVTSTGELVARIPVWSGPAIAGHSLDLALLYRTHVTASAMPELGPGWHLNAVDKVTATFDGGGDATTLSWTSGSGDVVGYPTYETGGPANNERWFKTPGSGHAFSQFRWYEHATLGKILERYRADGQVTRYERVVDTGVDYFRPKTVFDPFDNQTAYTYDASRRLASITDRRGVQIQFAWNAQVCSVSVWIGTTEYTDLRWSFMVDTSSRLSILTLPKTKYVQKAQQTDKLYNIGNEIEDQRTISFLYTNGLLTSVKDSRFHPTADAWVCTYVTVATLPRVQIQLDPYGRTHNFAYTAGSGSSVSEMRYRAPGGTLYTFTLDTQGRPTQVVANAAASGIDARPRLLAGDSIVEPSNLTWTLGYASCTCSLITSLTLPKGWAVHRNLRHGDRQGPDVHQALADGAPARSRRPGPTSRSSRRPDPRPTCRPRAERR